MEASFTIAGDYATVRLLLDGEPLGGDLDLFHSPGVLTTGTLVLGRRRIGVGPHRVTIESIGINPAAAKAYMVGLDYIRLVRATQK